MTKFFHNLSMQALSRNDDRAILLYRAILDKLLFMKLEVKKDEIEKLLKTAPDFSISLLAKINLQIKLKVVL